MTEQKPFKPFRSRQRADARVHHASAADRAGDDIGPGAANAYLGMKAGITIAATYPAAVIGMAVLRIFKGSILEENIARTAVRSANRLRLERFFTLPAFLIAGAWPSFEPKDAYWKSTALMVVGSILGVLFVSLVRRVMVEDPELPFPESVAASEIPQGRTPRRGSRKISLLQYRARRGHSIPGLPIHSSPWTGILHPHGTSGKEHSETRCCNKSVAHRWNSSCIGPSVSPAYIGVGYIIGPELASLNFDRRSACLGPDGSLLIFFLGRNSRIFCRPDPRANPGSTSRRAFGATLSGPSRSAE